MSWIPCAERLPEHSDSVIVSMGEYVFQAYWIPEFNFFSTDDGQYSPGQVLAWMPLPQPYRPEVKP